MVGGEEVESQRKPKRAVIADRRTFCEHRSRKWGSSAREAEKRDTPDNSQLAGVAPACEHAKVSQGTRQSDAPENRERRLNDGARRLHESMRPLRLSTSGGAA